MMGRHHTVDSQASYQELVRTASALFCYFSTARCQVCKVLRPKVEAMLERQFPRMDYAWIDMDKLPGIAGQLQIFVAPTMLVYFDGKENLRKSRNFSLEELSQEIRRRYALYFGD